MSRLLPLLAALVTSGCAEESALDDDTAEEPTDEPGVESPCAPCSGAHHVDSEIELERAAGCSSIEGDLTVFGLPDRETIELNCLESVGGDLTFGNNESATSLDLPYLIAVGGNVSIHYNDVLCQTDAETAANAIPAAGSVSVLGNGGVCE